MWSSDPVKKQTNKNKQTIKKQRTAHASPHLVNLSCCSLLAFSSGNIFSNSSLFFASRDLKHRRGEGTKWWQGISVHVLYTGEASRTPSYGRYIDPARPTTPHPTIPTTHHPYTPPSLHPTSSGHQMVVVATHGTMAVVSRCSHNDVGMATQRIPSCSEVLGSQLYLWSLHCILCILE